MIRALNDVEQRAAVREFVNKYEDLSVKDSSENKYTQSFWIDLLRDIFGVKNTKDFIAFQKTVKLKHISYIDGYIKSTKVLIEQKSKGIDLLKPIKQSDGSLLTPFEQAERYANKLSYSEKPRWIVTCNFDKFLIYDMDNLENDPEEILLKNLGKEYYRLNFLVKPNVRVQKEMEVSIKAGEIIGKIYNALLKQYNDPTSEGALKSLNILCVRLVFCLYAEDAGLFGQRSMFLDYLREFDARKMRGALIDLFKVLDTEKDKRDEYLDYALAEFPYVNGGLFTDDTIAIPQFTDEIRELLLENASSNFDWSYVSPTIFGALFESTLNPVTRRSGGMHYTSVENIHKVIDPLFLNDLARELDKVKSIKVKKDRNRALLKYQDKLASLKFLDPACGSGNFLTETYICLRRLENKAIDAYYSGERVLGDLVDVIKVSIDQFYGIEINDFAVTVAKTAMWIAESQMKKETEDIIHKELEFLPLQSYVNIVEANALRIDWEEVVSKAELNYIMGNPPFVGYKLQSTAQKQDLISLSIDSKTVDYVAGWYFKSANYIKGTNIRCAFVSTNSICQGEQATAIWKQLVQEYSVNIDFAWRTFKWESEAALKATVHVVIVGFSCVRNDKFKMLFDGLNANYVEHINPYLVAADDVFVEKRSKPLCDSEIMIYGSEPREGGHLILSSEERMEILAQAPILKDCIKKFVSSDDFINNRERYCLWFLNNDPSKAKASKIVMNRLELCREFRENSKQKQAHASAVTPYLFTSPRQPSSDYLLVPVVSSERRKYIPIGYMSKDVIASNACFTIANARLYTFGILNSNVHNAWVRAVCGRLEMRYRYSNTIVYNNFPWCNPTEAQRAKIEKTAQEILDARALYPDNSLADLYDEATMPIELRRAHRANDRAVMEAYGFWRKFNSKVDDDLDNEIVAELMKMYQKLIEE